MNSYYSYHYIRRLSQRNISQEDVQCAILFGRSGYRKGAKYFFLGRKELNKNNINDEHLDGLTVIVGENGLIITAYKNKNAIKNLKR
ncbi:DUF4258 domain-containing protein [bacterium]|nr:DUF4258 domain-containing protein [bacterium]MBU1635292.1 DUF4258 domain-containing protein [bacterium]MBU1873622.1 DUF4258 domain-containing protein [bacterium]